MRSHRKENIIPVVAACSLANPASGDASQASCPAGAPQRLAGGLTPADI